MNSQSWHSVLTVRIHRFEAGARRNWRAEARTSRSPTHTESSGFGLDCLRASASADLDPARLRPRRHGNPNGEDALIVRSSDGFPIQSFSEEQLTAELVALIEEVLSYDVDVTSLLDVGG